MFGKILGDTFDVFKDAGEQSLGIVMDYAKAASSTLDKGSGFGKASNQFTSSFAQRQGAFMSDHKTVAALSRAVTGTLAGGLQLATLPQHYEMRAFSTGLQYTGIGGNKAFNDNPNDLPSLSQAWKNSDRTSPAQALWMNLGLAPKGATYENVWRYGERGDNRFDPSFSAQTGTFDAVLAFVDPLILGGKAAKATQESLRTIKAADLEAAASRTTAATRRGRRVQTEFNGILDATDGKSAYENAVLFNKKGVNNATGLASVMAQAKDDRELRRLTLLTAMGDQGAKAQLTAMRSDIMGQIDNLNKTIDEQIVPRFLRTPDQQGLFDFEYHQQIGDINLLTQQRDSLENTLDTFNRILPDEEALHASAVNRSRPNEDDFGLFASVQQRMKVTNNDLARVQGAVSGHVFQPGIAGIPVRVLRAPRNLRPTGYIDFHDADQGVRELEAVTRHVPGMDPTQRTEMISRYVNAPDDNARRQVLTGIETDLLNHLGSLHGYAEEDMRGFALKMLGEREAAKFHFAQQHYGFLADGSAVHDALLEAQLQNGQHMLPFDVINRVLARNAGRYSALKNVASKSWSMVDEMADLLNDAWRFEALFRGGYPIRNAIDGQLRILAYLGAHQTAQIQLENVAKGLTREKQRTARYFKGEGFDTPLEALGRGTRQIGPYKVADAAGVTHDEVQHIYKQISSADTIANFVGGEYTRLLNKFRGSGDWKSKLGHEDGWAEDYIRVVNQQFRQSAITQRLLRGDSPEDVVTWLKSAAGRRVRRRMVFGSDTAEALVQRNLENLNHAVPPEFWGEVSSRPIGPEDITRMFGEDPSKYPAINAEQIKYSQGEGHVAEALAKIRDGYFNAVSSLTDDVMGRHPLFVSLYRGKQIELMKRIDPKLKGTLDLVEQKVIEEQARTWARKEMKNIMFDVSQKSDLAHFMRFLMPFYAAWQDAIVKYSRLLMRDPSKIGWFAQAWTAPNDSSLIEVTDANGNPVPASKSRLSDNEYLRIPSGIAKKFGIPFGVNISKASFNIALQGDPIWAPGWGPMGQIPVNQAIRHFDSPEAADLAETFGILPYGVADLGPYGIKGFLSGALRQAAMPEGRKARLTAMVLQAEAFRAAQEGRPIDVKKVKAQVTDLMRLRWLTSALSPVSIQYTSPYQFYIDQSHAYDRMVGPGKRFKDYSEADAAFLKDFGEDYYVFRSSMSKTNVPISPSRRADRAARKIKDLINAHPQFAPMFIGAANTGTYDHNVYTLQEARQIGLSSDHWRDTYSDPMQAIQKSHVEQGWIEYNRVNDKITTLLQQRGLHSLNQKGAEDLANAKRQWIEQMAGPNGPAWGRDWYRDYNGFGTTEIVDFLDAAKAAVTDKRINTRPDMKALAQYLQAREAMRKVLATRSSRSITAKDNADLAAIWDQFTGSLVESNIVFGNIYARYLERDDLTKVAG